MKTALSIALGLCFVALVASRYDSSNNGRYSIYWKGARLLKLDTQTGRVWEYNKEHHFEKVATFD